VSEDDATPGSGHAGWNWREPRGVEVLVAALAVACVGLAIWGAARGGSKVAAPAAMAGVVVAADATRFWFNPDKKHAQPDIVAGPEGESALQVNLKPGRKYFTILQKDFVKPQSWLGRPYFLLNYRGTGGGGTLQLVVDFAADNKGFAVYNIRDTTPQWRQLAFSTLTSDAVKGQRRWGHVVGLRLVGDKKATASIAVGNLTLAPRTQFAR
jgi:hypothetical protein